MPQIFRANNKSYTIPDEMVNEFLQDNPDAVKANRYFINNKRYTIPEAESETFLLDFPDAVDISNPQTIDFSTPQEIDYKGQMGKAEQLSSGVDIQEQERRKEIDNMPGEDLGPVAALSKQIMSAATAGHMNLAEYEEPPLVSMMAAKGLLGTPEQYDELKQMMIKSAQDYKKTELKNPEMTTAGEFIGFGAYLSPIHRSLKWAQMEKIAPATSKIAKAFSKVAETTAKGAAAGGIYGATRKLEEGESRLDSIIEDANLFALLDGLMAIPGGLKVLKAKSPKEARAIIEILDVTPEQAKQLRQMEYEQFFSNPETLDKMAKIEKEVSDKQVQKKLKDELDVLDKRAAQEKSTKGADPQLVNFGQNVKTKREILSAEEAAKQQAEMDKGKIILVDHAGNPRSRVYDSGEAHIDTWHPDFRPNVRERKVYPDKKANPEQTPKEARIEPVVEEAVKTESSLIPEITTKTSTRDAFKIGENAKGNPEAIEQLRTLEVENSRLYREARDSGDMAKASEYSYKGQMAQEAREVAEGKGGAAEFLASEKQQAQPKAEMDKNKVEANKNKQPKSGTLKPKVEAKPEPIKGTVSGKEVLKEKIEAKKAEPEPVAENTKKTRYKTEEMINDAVRLNDDEFSNMFLSYVLPDLTKEQLKKYESQINTIKNRLQTTKEKVNITKPKSGTLKPKAKAEPKEVKIKPVEVKPVAEKPIQKVEAKEQPKQTKEQLEQTRISELSTKEFIDDSVPKMTNQQRAEINKVKKEMSADKDTKFRFDAIDNNGDWHIAFENKGENKVLKIKKDGTRDASHGFDRWEQLPKNQADKIVNPRGKGGITLRSAITPFGEAEDRSVKEIVADLIKSGTLDDDAVRKAKQIYGQKLLSDAQKKAAIKDLSEREMSAPRKPEPVKSVKVEEAPIQKELEVSPGESPSYKDVKITKFTELREMVQDAQVRVKKLQEMKGVKVSEDGGFYDAEVRYHGRKSHRLEKLSKTINELDKEILKVSKKTKVPDSEIIEDINKYLVAKHTPERNAVHGDRSTGLSDDEAKVIISNIIKSKTGDDVRRIANKLLEVNRKSLDILHNAQVIDDRLYNQLKTQYKNHVPLQRIMDDVDVNDIGEVLTGGHGFSQAGSGLKRAKGSEREIADITTNIAAQSAQAINITEKNIVNLETLKFARENKGLGLFEEIKPKVIGQRKKGVPIYERIDTSDKTTVLAVREKGKTVYLNIKDKQLAEVFKGIGIPVDRGIAFNTVASVSRLYSGLATRFNLDFAIPNMFRDTQEMVVYMASQNKIGLRGALKTSGKQAGSMKDVIDYLKGKDTPGTRLYQELLERGGTTGGMSLSTKKAIEVDIEKIRRNNRSAVRKSFQKVVEVVDDLNTVFEDATRLSIYKKAIESGYTKNQAAKMAKEGTINFNKLGTGGPVVNALYIFSNAGIQGSAKMLKALRNPKVAAGVFTSVGGAVFAVNKWNDSVDPEWRYIVSKYDRMGSLPIMIPTNEGAKYITLPVSWGLKPIKALMDASYDLAFYEHSSIKESVSDIATSIIEGYNPVGGTDIYQAVVPTILDIPVDIARNKTWSGRKIKPDSDRYLPDAEKYYQDLMESTSGKYLIGITKELSENNILDVSPADAMYVIQQVSSGAGRFTGRVIETVSSISNGELPEPKETPLINRFYKSIPADMVKEYKLARSRNNQEFKEFGKKNALIRVDIMRTANKAVEEYKSIDDKKVKHQYIKDLFNNDKKVYETFKRYLKYDELGLDYIEKQVMDWTPAVRAEWAIEDIKSSDNPKKRMDDLIRKRILTKETYKEMKKLGFKKN